jgi:hypothetical protein
MCKMYYIRCQWNPKYYRSAHLGIQFRRPFYVGFFSRNDKIKRLERKKTLIRRRISMPKSADPPFYSIIHKGIE